MRGGMVPQGRRSACVRALTMRRASLITLLALLVSAAPASADRGLSATVGARQVDLAFRALPRATALYRDGARLATLPRGSKAYADKSVKPGGRYRYALGRARGDVLLPAYLVGAA